MIKEELKKEVEDKGVEYANNETPPKGEWIDAGYSYGQIVKAYEKGALDFAEPREKRIEELEAQIEKMKRCENCQTVRDAEGNCYLLKDGKCKNKDKWELRR